MSSDGQQVKDGRPEQPTSTTERWNRRPPEPPATVPPAATWHQVDQEEAGHHLNTIVESVRLFFFSVQQYSRIKWGKPCLFVLKTITLLAGKKLNSLRKEMRSLSTRCWQRGLTNEDVSAFDNTAVGGRWLSFSSGWQPVFICGRGYAASGYGCVGPMRVAPTTKTCYSSILQWRQVHLWPAVITPFITSHSSSFLN